MKTGTQIVLLVLIAGLVVVSISGCEDRDTGTNVAITPQASTITGVGVTVVLTAADPNGDLVMPLMWSVSNPSLGGILSASGTSAIYESNGAEGRNTITVTDQTDREGVAVISQQ